MIFLERLNGECTSVLLLIGCIIRDSDHQKLRAERNESAQNPSSGSVRSSKNHCNTASLFSKDWPIFLNIDNSIILGTTYLLYQFLPLFLLVQTCQTHTKDQWYIAVQKKLWAFHFPHNLLYQRTSHNLQCRYEWMHIQWQ